jgi:hypothetical protein
MVAPSEPVPERRKTCADVHGDDNQQILYFKQECIHKNEIIRDIPG